MEFSMDQAKTLLESGMREAQELVKEPSKVDGLLIQLEQKLQEVPAIGQALSDIPLMISLIKSYITRQYTNVSPKVILAVLGSFIYLVKKKDIIPDNVPVVGIADDLGVLTLALQLTQNELNAYKAWRDGRAAGDVIEPVPVEEAAADVGQDGNEGERQPGGPEPGFLPQVMHDEETCDEIQQAGCVSAVPAACDGEFRPDEMQKEHGRADAQQEPGVLLADDPQQGSDQVQAEDHVHEPISVMHTASEQLTEENRKGGRPGIAGRCQPGQDEDDYAPDEEGGKDPFPSLRKFLQF